MFICGRLRRVRRNTSSRRSILSKLAGTRVSESRDSPGKVKACHDSPGKFKAYHDSTGKVKACHDSPGKVKAYHDSTGKVKAYHDSLGKKNADYYYSDTDFVGNKCENFAINIRKRNY